MCFNQSQIYDNIAEKGGVGGLNEIHGTIVRKFNIMHYNLMGFLLQS